MRPVGVPGCGGAGRNRKSSASSCSGYRQIVGHPGRGQRASAASRRSHPPARFGIPTPSRPSPSGRACRVSRDYPITTRRRPKSILRGAAALESGVLGAKPTALMDAMTAADPTSPKAPLPPTSRPSSQARHGNDGAGEAATSAREFNQNQSSSRRIEAASTSSSDRRRRRVALAGARECSIFIQHERQHNNGRAGLRGNARTFDVAAALDADARARRPLRREAVSTPGLCLLARSP